MMSPIVVVFECHILLASFDLSGSRPAVICCISQMSSSLAEYTSKLGVAENKALRTRLILHRGWHEKENSNASSATRPLENTRNAYLAGATIGATYVECDVWSTQCGEMVLSHDETFATMAKDSSDMRAKKLISEQQWSDLSDLQLIDGSKPVLLKTVLEDLSGTGTKLAIELKQPQPAVPLANFLQENVDLVDSVGFIMGFAFESIEQFYHAYKFECGAAVAGPTPFPLLWLLCNPHPGWEAYKCDNTGGLTFFDSQRQTITECLHSQNLLDRFLAIHASLNIQYNRDVSTMDVDNIRSDLASLKGCDVSSVFLAMWSDRGIDPEWDSCTELTKWSKHLNALNTDLPEGFFQ